MTAPTTAHPLSTVSRLTLLLAATLALTATPARAADALTPTAAQSARRAVHPTTKPTIVLVHGAFADASSWNAVSTQLQGAGYPVVALPDPLRGVKSDAQSVALFLKTIQGPVVLVGHFLRRHGDQQRRPRPHPGQGAGVRRRPRP